MFRPLEISSLKPLPTKEVHTQSAVLKHPENRIPILSFLHRGLRAFSNSESLLQSFKPPKGPETVSAVSAYIRIAQTRTTSPPFLASHQLYPRCAHFDTDLGQIRNSTFDLLTPRALSPQVPHTPHTSDRRRSVPRLPRYLTLHLPLGPIKARSTFQISKIG
jgi:hypothetical protein